MSLNDTKMINGKGVSAKMLLKHKVTDEYILQSAVNKQNNAKLAISLSNKEILYFDNIKKTKALSFKGHQKTITDIKFSKESQHMLYSSSLDGTILVWDTRSGGEPVTKFSGEFSHTQRKDDSDGDLKPIICFDMSADEKFICGGTELIREDSFLIFWDMRTAKTVGGYWNSHTDEITQIQFHSTSSSGLATSSVDGLINVFDLTETAEEDALINTLNIETSINRFCWNSEDSISCITGTEEYQFWSTEKTSPSLSVTRNDLAEKCQDDVDYLIDTFHVDDSFYLASGSNVGCVHLYSQKEKGLKQVAVLEDGHTDVVRAISYCQAGTLITGGEDGVLCTWKHSL